MNPFTNGPRQVHTLYIYICVCACIGFTLVSKIAQDLPVVDNNMMHKGRRPEAMILFSTEGKFCTILETKV